MSTAPTKRCTIALSGGAGSVFSIKFSLSWQIKHLLMLPDDRLIPSQGSPHGGKPAQKGDFPRLIGRTKGDLNSKLHIVCDGHGCPILFLLTEGLVSDYKGAAILQHLLPDACTFLTDGGYDASWLREFLRAKGMAVCIPPRRTRNRAFSFDKALYKNDILLKIHSAGWQAPLWRWYCSWDTCE